ILSLLAEEAGVDARIDGIEKNKSPLPRIADRLNETVLIDRQIRECRAQSGPLIVVAREELDGNREFAERLFQQGIGARIGVMRKISGDNAKLGIAMMAIDVRDCRSEPLMRVAAKNGFAFGDKM